MKLLWVTNIRFGVDLCQTTELEAASALQRKGWEITFMSPKTEFGEEVISSEGHRAVLVESSSIPGLQSLSLEKRVAKTVPTWLEHNDCDVILADWSVARGVAKGVKNAKIPWLVDDRSPPVSKGLIGLLQWFHYKSAWKTAAKQADGFSVITPVLEDYIQAKFDIKAPMVKWPSGVNVSAFEPATPLKHGEVLGLVYHGSLDQSRNLLTLVEVGSRLIERGHDVRLNIFGNGNMLGTLSEIAQSREWLIVSGPQPQSEVPNLLKKCHIGLIPLEDLLKWSFSSPLKLFEYAASGLAVVASDIPPHQTFGKRSWLRLADTADLVGQMVERIEQLILEDEWEIITAQAREDAMSEFTWDHSISDLGELLRNLAQMKR